MTEVEFNPNPILFTVRLCLRPLTDEDAPQIFALRSDPRVNQYLDRMPCKTLEDAKVFISGIIERAKDSSLYYWAVCIHNECIGAVCLFDISEEEQSIEIGFELMPKYFGNGYMLEATSKVVNFIFEQLKLKTINAVVHPDNSNSIKLLEKLKFAQQDSWDRINKSKLISYQLEN